MPARRSNPWTPERDAELRQLAAAGHSTHEIAMQMHTTRNSIIGRLHRQGIKTKMSRAAGAKKMQAERNGNGAKKRRPVPRSAPFVLWGPRVKRTPKVAPQVGKPPAQTMHCEPIGLLELKHDTCRYPVTAGAREIGWEHMRFCGASVLRRSYCAVHCAQAYERVRAVNTWGIVA